LRYTGSVNRFLWKVVIPFLLCLYVIFVLLENHYFRFNHNAYAIAEKKLTLLRSFKSVDGIILGGSNAFYGLSAFSLSQLTGQRWANLALIAEGYSDENYWEFISSSLTNEQRLNLSYVIYSSSTPFSSKIRDRTSLDLGGKQKLSYRPQYSLASYLKRLLGYSYTQPIPNNYGDFNFANYDCNYLASDGAQSFDYMTENDLTWWISKQVNQMQLLFPNAAIFVELPNALHSEDFDYASMDKMVAILRKSLQEHQRNSQGLIYFTTQDSYPTASLMCNDSWHANKFGRVWRTKALSSKMDVRRP
jgi:hypothetical protein